MNGLIYGFSVLASIGAVKALKKGSGNHSDGFFRLFFKTNIRTHARKRYILRLKKNVPSNIKLFFPLSLDGSRYEFFPILNYGCFFMSNDCYVYIDIPSKGLDTITLHNSNLDIFNFRFNITLQKYFVLEDVHDVGNLLFPDYEECLDIWNDRGFDWLSDSPHGFDGSFDEWVEDWGGNFFDWIEQYYIDVGTSVRGHRGHRTSVSFVTSDLSSSSVKESITAMINLGFKSFSMNSKTIPVYVRKENLEPEKRYVHSNWNYHISKYPMKNLYHESKGERIRTR